MNEIIKKFNEGVISELCKVLAIRYKYADGEAMTWITKNILSFTKEIDGHQYGLKIVQLDGELPQCGEFWHKANKYINVDTVAIFPPNPAYWETHYHDWDEMRRKCPVLKAGYKYRVIEEEK